MNRKASMFFMPLLLAVVLISLTLMYVKLIAKQEPFSKEIGLGQGAILATQARAQKALFFVDMSARYAADAAAAEDARSGGYYYGSECGSYLGFQLWNSETRDCWPETPEEDFEHYMNDALGEVLVSYPDADTSGIGYAIIAEKNRIFGYATGYLEFDILAVQPDFDAAKIVERQAAIVMERLPEAKTVPEQASVGAYAWPGMDKTVTSCYGWRNIDYGSTEHRGIDIRASIGDPVMAITDGTVILPGDQYNTVAVANKNGIESLYLHNSEILVKAKQEVKKGDIIARAGKAGAKYPHIHLTVKKNGQYIDPLDQKSQIFDASKLEFAKSANCIYACSQYSYCNIIRGTA